MSVLSGLSIQGLDFIKPFHDHSVHQLTGMSFGLSHASYDLRAADTVVLPAHGFVKVSTMEHITMPLNLVAELKPKSTLARDGFGIVAPLIEPGWRGHLTVVLTSHSDNDLEIIHGQPIAAILFHMLDRPVPGYNGKYQGQPKRPVGAIKELAAPFVGPGLPVDYSVVGLPTK